MDEELKRDKEIAIMSSVMKVLDGDLKNESDEIRDTAIRCWRGGFEEGAKWMAKQGVTYEDSISSDKTFPVLPMKDVSMFGFDYGDKVIVQIRKK